MTVKIIWTHNLLGGGEGKSECVSGKRRKKKYNELTKSQLIEKELTELFEEIDSSREHMEEKMGKTLWMSRDY